VTKPTAFWDASALVPLCVREATTDQARMHLRRFAPVVWWGSAVEVHSAVSRLYREGAIDARGKDGALARLRLLTLAWREILPGDPLRELAGTLLDRYLLRAADSLQLAAALTWCQQNAAKRTLICADRRLGEAAKSAGFTVVELYRNVP
jgi:predicted nucleic acid-binding protein